MKRAITTFLGVLLFFLLPACRKQSVNRSQQISAPTTSMSASNKDTYDVALHELHKELTLVDIPVPLYQYRIPMKMISEVDDAEQSDVVLGYASLLSVADLVMFYQQEMERLGWMLIKHFATEQESVLVFNAPRRICVVTIQPFQDNATLFSKIVLCVGLVGRKHQEVSALGGGCGEYGFVHDDLW
jgi:hypothetical protein